MEQRREEDWERQVNEEVRRNFDVFQKLLPEILEERRGKIALMRDKQIVDYFDTRLRARAAAEASYPDGIWSIQEVTDEIAYLGPIS